MNILLFSADYVPDIGGIAAHVYYISRALAELGSQVTVIGGHLTPLGNKSHLSIEKGENIREVKILRSGIRGFRALFFILRAWKVLKSLAGEPWDVVHYHNFISDGVLLGLMNWPRSKVRVFTNHSTICLEKLDRGDNLFIERLLVRATDGLIAPSEELKIKSRYIAKKEQRIEFIPNGVDTSLFHIKNEGEEIYDLLGVSPEQKIFVAVRRHDPKNGLHYLIQAIPLIIKEHNKVVFCLIGDGEETPRLKKMADEMGVSGYVKFIGRMNHSTIPSVFRVAYASLLPSYYEAVSLSGLESLACGCPVIGTNVGGIPEFLKDGQTGLLIKPHSPEAIAEAVNFLIENPGLRKMMSNKAHDFVVEKYSWQAIASKTLQFYKELLNQKRIKFSVE